MVPFKKFWRNLIAAWKTTSPREVGPAKKKARDPHGPGKMAKSFLDSCETLRIRNDFIRATLKGVSPNG
jgi:hypothetical protein